MSNPKDLNSPSSWNMRIWDCKKNQWLCDGEDDVLPYYGFDIRGGEVTAMQSMDWVYRQFEHGRKLIWERSTGIKDRNGKEIYEGDIIQETIEVDDATDGTYRYEVYWDEDMLCWSVKGVSDSDYHLRCDLWQANASREVIGNIHENPELLGGGE